MRYFPVLIFAGCAFAQNPETDQPILQKLLVEVQQLRVAIQQSTLLGTRTQIALSQLQLQEGKVTDLSRELAGLRESVAHAAAERATKEEQIRRLEDGGARNTIPQSEFEGMLKGLRLELEQFTAAEQRAKSRESELFSQFQQAQRYVQDSRARIAEMERALDTAIQQLLKGK